MKREPIGLYVHIPFCLHKCAYCDFCSYAGVDAQTRARVLDALCLEIASYPAEKDRPADTVFFGGGTPSLLTPDEFSKVFSTLKANFCIQNDAEITVECNPKTLDREKLLTYRALGVNRLSIGVQTASDEEAAFLGRIHTFRDFEESVTLAREVGFNNLNVDLMYAFPTQTEKSFRDTLAKVLAYRPEHVSAYSLIVEEGTPFFELAKKTPFPDGDAAFGYYQTANEVLRDAGYSHYEISNYAKPGYECRHNLHYWHGEEYLGFGPAAYSFLHGSRYGNPRSLSSYTDGSYVFARDGETLDTASEAYEYAMCAFRLSDGLSLRAYREKFGVSFEAGREEKLAEFLSRGLLVRDGDRLFCTEDSLYVSNAILVELL